LCVVVKPLKQPVQVYRYDKFKCKPGAEKKFVRAVNDILDGYDLLIGHNIIRFDLPWLRSRSVFFDLPELPLKWAYDTCRVFRRLGYKTVPNGLGKPSAGLAHVTDFYDLDQEKTGIYPRAWWKSVWAEGPKERSKALDNIVAHCISDVRMNEQIYWKLVRSDRGTLGHA